MRTFVLVVVALVLAFPANAQEPRQNAFYAPEVKDPALKKIEDENAEADKSAGAVTDGIRKKQEEAAKAKKEARRHLRAELPEADRPSDISQFSPVFHFPPQAQYLTGTCWSYCGTSFLESEVKRVTGSQVKLSEMYPVYWEYVEKARRFVRERGDSNFGEGSEVNAVLRMAKLYGAVPLQAYPGRKDGKRDAASGEVLHDHSRMAPEMTSYLQWVKQQGMWDEEAVVAGVRAILDRHLGAPPTEFEYEGKKYTPRTFFQKVVKVGPDDYVQFMSTLSEPFFKTALFDVPDNWWKDDTYHNVPLDVFYDVIVKSVAAGYSIGIGGDVSEPGKDFAHSAAFVPSFDIPSDHIDQSAREYRITNGSTGDDHGVHLVGMADVGGHKWFLIKDSGRSARWAKPEGYYFFRDDFVKLKMLTIMVHKDAVPELVERFEEPGAPRQDESGR